MTELNVQESELTKNQDTCEQKRNRFLKLDGFWWNQCLLLLHIDWDSEASCLGLNNHRIPLLQSQANELDQWISHMMPFLLSMPAKCSERYSDWFNVHSCILAVLIIRYRGFKNCNAVVASQIIFLTCYVLLLSTLSKDLTGTSFFRELLKVNIIHISWRLYMMTKMHHCSKTMKIVVILQCDK